MFFHEKVVFLLQIHVLMAENEPKKSPARPRLRLPFDNRRQDAGEWAFDHRAGLCLTLIAYLVLMIAFVSSKIVVGRPAGEQGFYIDLTTLAELEAEKNRLEREIQERRQQETFDFGKVSNKVSNDNMLDETLRDDRGTRTAELNASAAAVGDRMRANREAYEQGLAEADAIRVGEENPADEGAKRQDVKIKGSVTVRFDLKNPTRTERHLVIPAYLCEGGGEVVVAVTVNPNGEVVASKVLQGGDDCMRETALRAARQSTFNIDPKAPARQTGTITYLFIPQ